MGKDVLLSFGDNSVATVRQSGIVDIRVVDDHAQRTLTSRMQIDEFARMAKAVFMNVRNDAANSKKERDIAEDVNGKIMKFLQAWGE